MLKERIQADCVEGEGCANVILRAAAAEYGVSLPEEVFAACGGIQGGFGIHGMCGALIGGVMALGLLLPEEEIKGRRILFLLKAQERFGGLDCCRLAARGADCTGLLEEIAEILQDVIEA